MLKQNAYAANTDIGCSGYRIDVGIVHPDKPDEYILGIMCDGAASKNARTARNREVLQFNVLSQLGWNTHKVYVVTQLLFETMSADEFCLTENTTKIRQKIVQVISSRPQSAEICCANECCSLSVSHEWVPESKDALESCFII